VKTYALFDIGGTYIKYGLADEKGSIVLSSQMATEAIRGAEHWMKKVADKVNELKLSHELCGVCIASMGVIDTEEGRVVHANSNAPGYTGFEIRKYIERETSLPCEVENDVNAMALAESISGSGKGERSVLCLALGTGFGGGLVIDSRVFHGSSYSAMEVGYIEKGDSTLERLCSVTGLIESVRRRKGILSGDWNGRRVFEEAENGDMDCLLSIDELAVNVAAAIGMMCSVLDPAVVVLSGSVMAQSILLEKIRRYFTEHNEGKTSHIRIEAASYLHEAGMVGALYHFLQKHYPSSLQIDTLT